MTLVEKIKALDKKIQALKRERSRIIEELYAQQLRKIVDEENTRMQRKMSVYYDEPEGLVSEHARGKQDQMVHAVKELGIATCLDIALKTGIAARSVQAAIGDLVRKGRLVRLPSGPGHIKKYRLPRMRSLDETKSS